MSTRTEQDWFDSLTLEEFLEQTETCESEWNAFMKKEYGNLPERPDLPEPSEDELPW